MDNKILVITIFAIVVTVILIVVTQLWKQSIFKKLFSYLQQGKFDEYFKLLDSFGCKYFYPAFNREYMRLNGYMMKADVKKIEECFDLILHMRMNKKQELDVVIKAFYYYLDEENKKKCKTMLTRLKNIADENIYKECKVIYDILLEEKTIYIDDMEEQLKEEGLQAPQKGMFHYMLALQYSYLNNGQKKREHLKEASRDLKGTPYEMKIQELMKAK